MLIVGLYALYRLCQSTTWLRGSCRFVRPTPIMTTGGTADPAERLASAQKLREEGNAKFKEQDLGRRSIALLYSALSKERKQYLRGYGRSSESIQ